MGTPEDTITLTILGHCVKARRLSQSTRYYVYWMDTSGWEIWPEMEKQGYLAAGKTIPGTYGDYPIYVTDQTLQENQQQEVTPCGAIGL